MLEISGEHGVTLIDHRFEGPCEIYQVSGAYDRHIGRLQYESYTVIIEAQKCLEVNEAYSTELEYRVDIKVESSIYRDGYGYKLHRVLKGTIYHDRARLVFERIKSFYRHKTPRGG